MQLWPWHFKSSVVVSCHWPHFRYWISERIMKEATTTVCNRRELWEDFKSLNKKRRAAAQSHAKNVSDVPARLDNIERLLKSFLEQSKTNPLTAALPSMYPANPPPYYPWRNNPQCERVDLFNQSINPVLLKPDLPVCYKKFKSHNRDTNPWYTRRCVSLQMTSFVKG